MPPRDDLGSQLAAAVLGHALRAADAARLPAAIVTLAAVDDEVDVIIDELTRLESRLRELAYDRLRSAAEGDDAGDEQEERRLQRARRAVAKAVRELGGEPEGAWG